MDGSSVHNTASIILGGFTVQKKTILTKNKLEKNDQKDLQKKEEAVAATSVWFACDIWCYVNVFLIWMCFLTDKKG